MACMAVSLVGCGHASQKGTAPEAAYLDPSKDIETRVEDALSRMTRDEKLAVIHAQSKFSSAGVPRLGIPEVWTDDGPHGVRPEVFWDQWNQAGWTNDSCTAFPALTCLAATWDTELSALYGKSVGEEARYRKKDILLGPGVNIYRTPVCGRNFEYMGEDPYLSSQTVVPYVQGVQGNGVAVCVKHYALNNQELNRNNTDVNVSDRALYEIYLPAFKAAVMKGGAWAVMGSYNLYKGFFNCHNPYLVNDILKGEFGFDGVLVSDWGGTHDTVQAAENGLDMEFGTWTNGLTNGVSNAYDNYYMARPYRELLIAGKQSEENLDNKVRRVLRLIFRTSMNPDRPYGKFTSPEHYAAARKIGSEGIVLLKNDGGVLPMKDGGKILVVGENAIKPMTVGGGSSSLKVQHEISPLQGIQERFKGANVEYQRGYVGDPTSNYNGVKLAVDLSEERPAEQLIADAVAAASDADYVIFIGGLNKSNHQDAEGADRLSLGLPYGQDAVIEALAAVNPHLVVVNISGSSVAMPWLDKVPAVVQDWYLGSEAGRSLADVLSGDVNPSGKLPFTFPVALEDGPVRTVEQYPGIPYQQTLSGITRTIYKEDYSEGIYVGYRWFEKQGIKPLFPFGHGLSYTTFEVGDASVRGSISSGRYGAGSFPEGRKRLTVKVPVKNTGSVDGAEVVQLYICAKESSVDRPVKELKGYKKVFLRSGESAEVAFELDPSAVAYFDEGAHQWVAEPGAYQAMIGVSSADIRTTVDFNVK